MEGIEYLRQFNLVDSEHEINNLLKAGKSVLCEGAQGTMLDVDFGSYPFVTSSNTICLVLVQVWVLARIKSVKCMVS